MRFSRSLKSSSQSQPAPNGVYIATIFATKLCVRVVQSLEIVRTISLPAEFVSAVKWFLWSESSDRILLASQDEIRVYSMKDTEFYGHVKHPTSTNMRVVYISFGADDDEVCIFTELGLKVFVVNFRSSRSVDINTPKLFTPATASKGFTYRPQSKNLALLTRHGGKDVISIHAPETYEVTRSWYPDTIDSQGLTWSPDGKWLLVWESPAFGHKALVYTADGHLFKKWNGSVQLIRDDNEVGLGAGITLFSWASTGALMAIGDSSTRINIVATPTFKELVDLQHSVSVTPSEAFQVWQEQILPLNDGGYEYSFSLASQTVSLPTSDTLTSGEARLGTNLLQWDTSGTLLVSRTQDMPTVLWIWDLTVKGLRTVLILHAAIAKVLWHPTIPELLMIHCEGDNNRSLVHLWDPSWPAPRIENFASQMIGGKVLGKTTIRWLVTESRNPAIFFSDLQDCILACLADETSEDVDDLMLPWKESPTIYNSLSFEESPLNLVPAHNRYSGFQSTNDSGDSSRMSAGSEDVDDTFSFKKMVNPMPGNNK